MEILPASELSEHSVWVWCYLDSEMKAESRPSRVNARENNTYYYNSNITHCEPGTGLNTLHSFNRPNNPLR